LTRQGADPSNSHSQWARPIARAPRIWNISSRR